jgi:transketolase
VIPQLDVWRPADGLESSLAWSWCVQKAAGATVLCFTRQGLAPLDYAAGFDPQTIWKGAYILKEAAQPPQAVIVATGSEVALASQAQALLAEKGIHLRVVSMPCVSVFESQDAAYRQSVLGKDLPLCSVEAGSTLGWKALVGPQGLAIGIDHFGQSGPGDQLAEHFGFSGAKVAAKIEAWISANIGVKA